MFSHNIQNLINTSGKDAAVQRIVELKNYVANLDKSTLDNAPDTSIEKFSEVLKSSDAGASRFKILNQNEVVAASATEPSTVGKVSKSRILDIISKVSQKYGVDEKLIQAIVKQESGFNPNATSHCGAMGLMQLMPSTAKGLGVKNPYDPIQNIEGGVKYIKAKLEKYNGNLILALASYNAGSGNVEKYGGVPPFKETQNYVKSILANYLG